MTTSSPSRLLSNVIKGANELQAINIGNNVGEPAGYNFDNNEPVGDSGDGIVSTLDESTINSPLHQKNGSTCYEQIVDIYKKIRRNHDTDKAQGLVAID